MATNVYQWEAFVNSVSDCETEFVEPYRSSKAVNITVSAGVVVKLKGGRRVQEPNEPLQDLDWLSEFIGIPPRTIYNWRLRGEGPPAYRVGRHLRFRRSEVDAWLDGRRDKAQGAA